MAEKKSRTKKVHEGGNTTVAVSKETQKKLRLIAAELDMPIKDVVAILVNDKMGK